ncbi:hypothetical protein KUCAC02_004218 [Chaenocephalus aceratus]|uniref:Uncharacterized protein n=1 Tax=Chaenocephalus aceratus TaxID=36190 RepID=A0ACB9WXY1_CHAAC|nr:hypothetical protein KUCAC02_004218 [Chaenocephalus aceratus]
MWCYQKPGFEALLLAELQRQQQCSQFCDTLLKTEGVSVPAHSCVLSALSPHFSSTLSSAPQPPAGQSHLLEFRALSACTLLHMVRLLYCGEMAGEGEKEKQEAISAAAKLGIHGLVEVTKRQLERGSVKGDGGHTEAGSLGQTTSHFVPPQIPYVPISLVYPPNENPTQQPSYALMDSMQESTSAAGFMSILAPQHTFVPQTLLPFSSQGPPCAAGLQSWWAAPQEAAGEAAANEWEDQNLEQFDGNITGYIHHFLNPDKEEGVGRGRARRRRGAGEGGARRGGAGERRARRSRAGTGGRGRGRGGLTQMVDVQEVGVSRLQKLFLQRVWGGTPRTGQGGGAAGRKLFLKPRELLKSTKKRGPGKVWGVGDVLPYKGERGGQTQHGRKRTTQEVNPNGLPVGRPRRGRPPRLPPHEEQPEHIERLLEEVMNDLDILKNNGAPQPPPPTRSSDVASCGNTVTQNKSGSNGYPRVVVVARGGGSPSVANPGTPILQQQGEGELNETLYTLLQSFEHYMDSCSTCEEAETGAQSRTEACQLHTVPRRNRRRRQTQTPKSSNTAQRKNTPPPARQPSDEAETPLRRSLSSARSAAPPEHTEGSTAPDKIRKRKRKRIKPYMLSLDRKRVRVRKPVSSSETKSTKILDQRDVKLLHTPGLKLERSGRLSDKVMERSCKEVKKSAKTKRSLSSVTQPREAAPPIAWSTKTYPIRSRLRKANMDSAPFLVEPLQTKRPSSAGPGRDSLSNESSPLPVEPQPMEPCVMDEQLQRNPETCEEELTVQHQEEVEEETRRGEKRHTEPEETGEESSVPKRVCFEQTAQPTSETCALSSKSADCVSGPAPRERRDIVSVETVPIAGECLPRQDETKRGEINIRGTDCEMESSGDEMIAVDGEPEDSDTSPQTHCVDAKLSLSPTSLSATEFSLTSTGSWEDDEDVDVIGGSSPAPDPVLFSWTECSEVEEEEGDEDIDVVGDNPIYTSSSLLATVR